MNEKKTTNSWMPALTRRHFVQSAGAAATVMVAGLSGRVAASELPRVDEDDAMAKALSYVHDAKSVDASIRPSDRFCYNCALYTGTPEDEWAGCGIFPGKSVAGAGWCSAWSPK